MIAHVFKIPIYPQQARYHKENWAIIQTHTCAYNVNVMLFTSTHIPYQDGHNQLLGIIIFAVSRIDNMYSIFSADTFV